MYTLVVTWSIRSLKLEDKLFNPREHFRGFIENGPECINIAFVRYILNEILLIGPFIEKNSPLSSVRQYFICFILATYKIITTEPINIKYTLRQWVALIKLDRTFYKKYKQTLPQRRVWVTRFGADLEMKPIDKTLCLTFIVICYYMRYICSWGHIFSI